jgi:Tol biopolymer transport system component
VRTVGLAAALMILAVATGCGGAGSEETLQHVTVSAPPQRQARLVAIRGRYDEGRTRREVVTLTDDGTNVRVVTHLPSEGLQGASEPKWAPDADRIFFTGSLGERAGADYHYEETDLFLVEPDGSGLRRLTDARDAFAPVPSPDGTTLAFARREHQGTIPFTDGLWLMGTGGGDERRLLDAQEGQIDVPGSWSPDGETLAFTRCQFAEPEENGMQPNTCGIYIVARDGSDVRKLAERARWPSFSEDGERIAFVSDRDENGTIRTGEDEQAFANELYVIDADGDDQRRVTSTEALDEEAPAWDPGGRRLAYEREGPASFALQLMIVALDGSCATAIAGEAARGDTEAVHFWQPSWRPGRLLGEAARLNCK